MMAIKYYNKALAIDLNNFGVKHLNIATEYYNLAMVYYYKGMYDKAIEYFEKSLEIYKYVFKNGHPYIDLARENLEYVKKAKENKN